MKAGAVRRCGELAKRIEPKHTGRPKIGAGDHPNSRKAAANGAGLSAHQLKQAVRVANVPHAEFERQVESPKPPTVTALAEQGKKFRGSASVPQFRAATRALGAVTCMKHGGFFEEREWRVIYSPLIQGMHSPLIEEETVTIHGVPQLVQKLPIDARVPAAAELDVARLFDHLIIGPTQYPMPIAHACIAALEKAGVSEVSKRITISDIPIRT